MGEWIKKMWYTHTHTHTHRGILFSHEKEEILPFVTICEVTDVNYIYYGDLSQ